MDQFVRTARVGPVGHLTLDRPAAINALTKPMMVEIGETLSRWREDDAVQVVLLDGAGDSGFCAGGDIKAVHRSFQAGDREVVDLWRVEYTLDHTIATFPKPVVSVMDRITMGGGMGLACHVSHRLVTARARLAMPEVRIGMAPDVGGCLLLARTPGRLGEHLALTSGVVEGSDAVQLGLADALIEPAALNGLAERVARDGPDQTLADVALPLPDSLWEPPRTWIDASYAADDVPEIIAALLDQDRPEAAAAVDTLRRHPPLALAVTLRALRTARELDDLADVLVQDFRVMVRFLDSPDPVEGIRARVIDKDDAAQWDPATFEALAPGLVDRHFVPLVDDLRLG